MVKVGVVGLGFMGVTHLQAYEKHPRAKLVAVADRIAERLTGDLSGVQGNLAEGGKPFDFSEVNTYQDAADLFADPEVELVSICLPTPFHADLTRQALESGKHVLCEKPMGLTAEDCDAMVAAARANSARFMVAQCIRFWPDYRKAREIAQSGALGAILSARFTRQSAAAGWAEWLLDESRTGGVILDLAVHDIDFAQHLLGVPEKVCAVGARHAENKLDQFSATLTCGGVPVTVAGGWFFPGEYPFKMSFDIFCEKGVLSYDSATERPLTIFHADGTVETPELPEGDGYLGEVDYLISCIEKGCDPELSPAEESALSVKLALLVRDSRAQGGVELETPAAWRA